MKQTCKGSSVQEILSVLTVKEQKWRKGSIVDVSRCERREARLKNVIHSGHKSLRFAFWYFHCSSALDTLRTQCVLGSVGNTNCCKVNC